MSNTSEVPVSKYTKPVPDMANVRYGTHERNVFDFWRGRGTSAPLVMFFHGGGFRRGDKNTLTRTFHRALQDEGFAVVSVNYRLSGDASYPAQMHDGARALQFMRSRAGEFGIDPTCVALTGSSAGAGISLWVGFHEDLVKPRSHDPVEQQSTRVRALGIFNGQCSYDPRFLEQLGLDGANIHPFFEPFYGLSRKEIDARSPQACKVFEDAAPITHLKAGAPPVYMVYKQPNDPIPTGPEFLAPVPGKDTPQIADICVHHPRLGYALKEKLDALGIESEVHPGARDHFAEAERGMVKFLARHLRL